MEARERSTCVTMARGGTKQWRTVHYHSQTPCDYSERMGSRKAHSLVRHAAD
jgi:hypothetical protein